jgi:hypothetical protein
MHSLKEASNVVNTGDASVTALAAIAALKQISP